MSEPRTFGPKLETDEKGVPTDPYLRTHLVGWTRKDRHPVISVEDLIGRKPLLTDAMKAKIRANNPIGYRESGVLAGFPSNQEECKAMNYHPSAIDLAMAEKPIEEADIIMIDKG